MYVFVWLSFGWRTYGPLSTLLHRPRPPILEVLLSVIANDMFPFVILYWRDAQYKQQTECFSLFRCDENVGTHFRIECVVGRIFRFISNLNDFSSFFSLLSRISHFAESKPVMMLCLRCARCALSPC